MTDRLAVRELAVATRQRHAVLGGVDLTIGTGEIVGLIGASGAGKTTMARALLGRAGNGLVVSGGAVVVDGATSVLDLRGDALRAVRGARLALVGQHPLAALDPARRVRDQVLDVLAAHEPASDPATRLTDTLAAVALAPALADRFPHELSGGERQRAALAVALVCRPCVLVLDEPTTGLDDDTRRHVTSTIRRQTTDRGLAVLWLTHDLDVVAEVADRLAVMHGGAIVEAGPTATVLAAPTHPHTAQLVAARPDPSRPRFGHRPRAVAHALALTGMSAAHGRGDVLHNVTLAVGEGEWLAVVGPSGAGKSTLLRTIAGLHPRRAGRIVVAGEDVAPAARRRTAAQRRAVHLVLQHPDAAFNPRRSVGASVARPSRMAGAGRADARRAAITALELVGLDADVADRPPRLLSGGERQRAAIARALVGRPRILLCDEITSSLDTITQAGVVDLLDRLRDQLDLAILFVTHDRPLARAVADRTVVLADGRLAPPGP